MKFPLARFESFCSELTIDSKERGQLLLTQENQLSTQKYFTQELARALEDNVHFVVCLKGRQEGVTTICGALDLFWHYEYEGMQGTFAAHEEMARDKFRAMLTMYHEGLPKTHRIKLLANNRYFLSWANRSMLSMQIGGGVKKKGGKGRGAGYTFIHATEVSSWEDQESLASILASLAQQNPQRLQIFESTARGMNMFKDIWDDANEAVTQRAIFIGWWRNELYRKEKGSPEYRVYAGPPTSPEAEWIRDVKNLYDFDISSEQLAWWRWENAEIIHDDMLMMQEFPPCVTAETRVGTKRGLLRIENIKVGDQTNHGQVLRVYPSRASMIYKATTALGYSLRGTADHPMVTSSGTFVSLAESLGETLRLAIPALSTLNAVVQWREGPVEHRVEITPQLGRFIGIFMGDGSFSIKKASLGDAGCGCLSIACDSKDVDFIQDCEKLIFDLFGLRSYTRKVSVGGMEIRVASGFLTRLFKRLGIITTRTGRTQRLVHVPEFIWNSPADVVKEFLSGLFETDGFNDYQSPRVVLYSKYRVFLEDVQRLILAFGISCKVASAQRKNITHTYIANELSMRKSEALAFNDVIGFLSKRKRACIETARNKRARSDTQPIVTSDRVVSVVEDGYEPVWNLTIEKDHLFDANGLLTHNTEHLAFILSGKNFFSVTKVKEIRDAIALEAPGRSYRFQFGDDLLKTQVEETIPRLAQYTEWEAPSDEGYYMIGADCAYGSSPQADRSVVEVYRCYADRFEQVAEFCTPEITTYKFAWVICALGGYYRNSMVNVEINGPGEAVIGEIENIRRQASSMGSSPEGKALRDVVGHMKRFLYRRLDTPFGGLVYDWKALALDTRLPTPSGWTTMGEVKKGDALLDDGGFACNVIGLSEVYVDHECYRVSFDDGTSIVADAEHLWRLSGGQLSKTYNLSEGDVIDVAKPLSLPEQSFSIDPYVLGVWLGDGHSVSGRISSSKDDIAEMSDNIQKCGFSIAAIKKDKRNNTRYMDVSVLGALLRKAKLLNNKHIPKAYLRSSYLQRLRLLQGLMDTDGSNTDRRQCSFTTTSKPIFEGFSELLRSLGFKAKYCVRYRTLLYKGELRECADAYQFSFTAYPETPVFRLSRKLNKQSNKIPVKHGAPAFRRGRSNRHIIVSVEPVESVPVRCVAVDSKSHLYLAGEAMVPTHNTNIDSKDRAFNEFRSIVEKGHGVIHSAGLADEMKVIVRKEGGELEASGSGKDDRVMASAIAAQCYVRFFYVKLKQMQVTWDKERAKRAKVETVGHPETPQEAAVARSVGTYLSSIGIKYGAGT